jgi:hypothetical protein
MAFSVHVCGPRQVADYFARLVQRVAPKHYAQAMAEVTVTRLFLENFSGDQVPTPCRHRPHYCLGSLGCRMPMLGHIMMLS